MLYETADQVEEVQLEQRHDEVAEQHGRTGHEAAPRDEAGGQESAEAGEDRHEHAASPESEERDTDDQIGEVVNELERENTRVTHLEKNHREGDEKGFEVQSACVHGWRNLVP